MLIIIIIIFFVRFITHLYSGETQMSQTDLMEFYQCKRDQHQASSIRSHLYCFYCESGCALIRVRVPLWFSAEEWSMVSTQRITKQAMWECITQPDLHSASHKQGVLQGCLLVIPSKQSSKYIIPQSRHLVTYISNLYQCPQRTREMEF